jgi:regulator of replication initiation timing
MVEEMQHISELAARGEQASRDVEEVKVHLSNLCDESRALALSEGDATWRQQSSSSSTLAISSDQLREVLQTFQRDLAFLKQEVDVLKEQLRYARASPMASKEVIADKAELTDERFSMLTSDVTALRGALAETVGTLRTELCQLAGQATETVPEVSRQD